MSKEQFPVSDDPGGLHEAISAYPNQLITAATKAGERAKDLITYVIDARSGQEVEIDLAETELEHVRGAFYAFVAKAGDQTREHKKEALAVVTGAAILSLVLYRRHRHKAQKNEPNNES